MMTTYLPREIETVDMRGDNVSSMQLACDRVLQYKETYPNIKYVIISRTQRLLIVKSVPQMYADAKRMSEQFEKPIADLDFQLVIERCHVIVE